MIIVFHVVENLPVLPPFAILIDSSQVCSAFDTHSAVMTPEERELRTRYACFTVQQRKRSFDG